MSGERLLPLIGTTYLHPDGTIYRLRDYGTDWKSDDLAETRPSYQVMHARGFSTAYELPAGCTVIWEPSDEATT